MTANSTNSPIILGVRQAKGFDDFGTIYLKGTAQIDPSEQGLWDQDLEMTQEEFLIAVERGEARPVSKIKGEC